MLMQALKLMQALTLMLVILPIFRKEHAEYVAGEELNKQAAQQNILMLTEMLEDAQADLIDNGAGAKPSPPKEKKKVGLFGIGAGGGVGAEVAAKPPSANKKGMFGMGSSKDVKEADQGNVDAEEAKMSKQEGKKPNAKKGLFGLGGGGGAEEIVTESVVEEVEADKEKKDQSGEQQAQAAKSGGWSSKEGHVTPPKKGMFGIGGSLKASTPAEAVVANEAAKKKGWFGGSTVEKDATEGGDTPAAAPEAAQESKRGLFGKGKKKKR